MTRFWFIHVLIVLVAAWGWFSRKRPTCRVNPLAVRLGCHLQTPDRN
jgi:hypothetical protein